MKRLLRYVVPVVLVLGVLGSGYAAIKIRQYDVRVQHRAEAAAKAFWPYHTTGQVVEIVGGDFTSSYGRSYDRRTLKFRLVYHDKSGDVHSGVAEVAAEVNKGQKVGTWVSTHGDVCPDIEPWYCNPSVPPYAGAATGRYGIQGHYDIDTFWTFIFGVFLTGLVCWFLDWLIGRKPNRVVTQS